MAIGDSLNWETRVGCLGSKAEMDGQGVPTVCHRLPLFIFHPCSACTYPIFLNHNLLTHFFYPITGPHN